jgi:hypothetical protein
MAAMRRTSGDASVRSPAAVARAHASCPWKGAEGELCHVEAVVEVNVGLAAACPPRSLAWGASP